MQNNNQNMPMETPDEFMVAIYNEAGNNQQASWSQVNVGSVVHAHNRNPRQNGTQHTQHKVQINVDKILQLISEGKLKKSPKGFVTIQSNILSEQAKNTLRQKQSQSQGGNQNRNYSNNQNKNYGNGGNNQNYNNNRGQYNGGNGGNGNNRPPF